jgi:ring-1,2-phenylacetyl-CoA epoxidase subunit PaaC
VDPSVLRGEFDAAIAQVLDAATIETSEKITDAAARRPDGPAHGGQTHDTGSGRSGRDGVHGPELTEILAEMQELARALPGGVW